MRANFDLMGTTARSGVRYFTVTAGTNLPWLPMSAALGGDKVLLPALAARNVHLFGKKEVDAFKARLSALSDFPPSDIAELPGWNGDAYALHDGSTFAADPKAGVPIAFELTAGKNVIAGVPKAWKNEVAAPLARQPLASFLLAAMFVPALLRFMPHVANFAIEVIGPEGIGKSTLLQVASSVYGGTGVGTPDRYWTSCATGADALPTLIGEHRDHPLVLDELNALYASPDKKVIERVYGLLSHDLGRGETACGLSHTVGAAYRGVVLLAANESLRMMAEKPLMAGDQIITLTAPSDWQHGVFVKLPKGYLNGAAFAEALSSAAGRSHGITIRKFLRRLLRDMATDQLDLQQRLDAWQNKFLTKAGVDFNNGKELRTARAFAAVYAGLQLAKRYKVLPPSILGLTAALTCYRLHRDAAAPLQPFRDRLEALIASDRIVAVSAKGSVQQMALIQAAVGTLHVKGEYRELRIPREKIRQAFPDWERLKGTAEFKALLVPERGKRGQNKSKARLAPGFPKERLYLFRLPLLERSMFDQPAAELPTILPAPAPNPDKDDGWYDPDDPENS